MRVFQRRRLNSSTCMRPQNDSIMALSAGVPTEPIDGAMPASRTFWLKAQDVNWVDSIGGCNAGLLEGE
jgi:hypothetical protein